MMQAKQKRVTEEDHRVVISLNVTGEKVRLQKFPHPVQPSYDVKRIVGGSGGLAPKREPNKQTHQRPNDVPSNNNNKRQTYKLSVKNYTNRDVHNNQLRRIYEAVEFDDFKRFLASSSSSSTTIIKRHVPKKEGPLLTIAGDVDVENFYRDNFETHYSFLKDVVALGHKSTAE